ncbi:MAG: sugar phosphate nucleotidyltransferase [PVC group bacterium]
MLHAVIMAGGTGERFWPLSRRSTPKQLLSIVGKGTMIEQTVARLQPLADESRIWVVTTGEQAPALRKILPEIPAAHILMEPVGRNTAPGVALAAYAVAREDPDAVMAILPADHLIEPKREFQKTIAAAAQTAERTGALITIGIKPAFPSTGYGYIRRGGEITETNGCSFYRVDRFVEKPDRKRARQFIRNPRFAWNSGIFIWSLEAIERALERHLPEVARALRPLRSLPARSRKSFLERVYPGLPGISIDCGIMEKHRDVLVTVAAFRWDDLGSWEALGGYLPRTPDGNRARGALVTHDANGCIGFSTGPLIGLAGVSNLIVAATGDAVLVCTRERAQDVKKLVQKIRKNKKYRGLM